LVWAICAVTVAQKKDVEGSKDHPLISRYPGSWITNYTQKDYDEFVLPLGKWVRGDKAEKTQDLEGKVTAIHYEAPAGRSALEVFRNYEGALRGAGFETLFTCAREGCVVGSRYMKVYGGYSDPWFPNQELRYLSARLTRPEGQVYVSLNVCGLAAVRMALYVVDMKPMEAGLVTVDAAALGGDIARTGHVAVYGIYFDTGKADVKPESDAALKEIAKLLQQDAKLKLYVVGHTDNVGALARNMDLSHRRANAVVQVLTTKYGVAAARLNPQGDGPTAPVASNDSEDGRAKNRRVELVKQ